MPALLSLLLVADPFPNWESAPVHSVALTDAGEVLVCNVAQATLEIFSATTPPVWLDAVSVGLDPVSVRVRPGSREAWVVNHVSDSVSVIDLDRRVITTVLPVLDEPGDVVFAGIPERAYVSCSTDECLLVFDPSNLDTAPGRIDLRGEEPKALAVDSSGQFVYAAFLCSGNRTTV
ncbi:MAG: YncE family protein, partial [Planctomycetota bacterium]|nr:YncE family protein [Planctomycetota bacterium]